MRTTKHRFILVTPLLLGLSVSPRMVLADATNAVAAATATSEQSQQPPPGEEKAQPNGPLLERSQTPPPSLEARQKLMDELRSLPPAEREARIQELRKRHGLPTLSPEMQKRREELLKLSPEQRRARLEELRRSRPVPPVDEKVRAQRRAALQQKLETLRARKAAGQLSAAEERMLKQLEQASRLLESNTAPPASNEPPAPKR